MYSCEVTTTSFRSMVASGEMRVIGGLRVALKKCDFLGICPNMGRGLNFQKSCLVILRCWNMFYIHVKVIFEQFYWGGEEGPTVRIVTKCIFSGENQTCSYGPQMQNKSNFFLNERFPKEGGRGGVLLFGKYSQIIPFFSATLIILFCIHFLN